MHTRATRMLGIDFPIFAFTHCRDVAAAVTNAGGFGVLGAVAHTPEQLEVDLTWIAEQTKGRPFGVDLLIPRKYVGAETGGMDAGSLKALLPDGHREWIEAVLQRYGVPPLPALFPDSDREQRGMAGLRIDPKSMEPTIGDGSNLPYDRQRRTASRSRPDEDSMCCPRLYAEPPLPLIMASDRVTHGTCPHSCWSSNTIGTPRK